MILKLKSMYEGEEEVVIDGSATVAELKAKIRDINEISPEQQRLVCAGVILGNNNATLSEYKLTSGSFIHMVLALRGG